MEIPAAAQLTVNDMSDNIEIQVLSDVSHNYRSKHDMNKLISMAELEIARILKQLEIDTGSVVECVDLIDFDTTGVDDDRLRITRHVQLTLKRLPGTNWSV